MPPERLDHKLAEGWFRSGPLMMRADLLTIADRIHGVFHVRLPLKQETKSRNRRRVLRRNRERFRCVIGPAQVDADRRGLYEATKPRFIGFLANELDSLVFGAEPDAFDTHECSVYDGERLVAVSYFDVGTTSISSQLGLYDPSYARFSLGFYTMLEEIEYAREVGLTHYYPGYVIPDLPAMNYKLNIGPLQYLGGDGRWRRRAQPPKQARNAERLKRRTAALARELERKGVVSSRRFYAGFWIGHVSEFNDDQAQYLQQLVHFRCGEDYDPEDFVVIEYDSHADRFVLSRVWKDQTLDLTEGNDLGIAAPKHYEMSALAYHSIVLQSQSEREIARAAQCELGRNNRRNE